jgi:hypothetical protein
MMIECTAISMVHTLRNHKQTLPPRYAYLSPEARLRALNPIAGYSGKGTARANCSNCSPAFGPSCYTCFIFPPNVLANHAGDPPERLSFGSNK